MAQYACTVLYIVRPSTNGLPHNYYVDTTIIHVERGPTQLLFAHRGGRAGGGTRKEEGGRVLAFSAYDSWLDMYRQDLATLPEVSYQITQ